MAKSSPTDRFDAVPDNLVRVGAHRAAARRGRGWIAFAWAALVTGVLVAAGAFGLSVFAGSINGLPLSSLPFSTPTPEPSAPSVPSPSVSVVQTAPPVVDPAIAITVLNGTTTTGLANRVGDILVAKGWGGAATGVGTRANAAVSTIPTTVVFYADPIHEGAARALVQAVGVGEIRLGNDYPSSPMTVLVGSDYIPPAG